MFSWPILGTLALASYLGTFPYRQVWARNKGTAITAKGYGVLLPFFVMVIAVTSAAPVDILWPSVAVSVMTAIYWIDDVGDLKVAVRFSLQFGAGVLLAWLALQSGTGNLPLPLPLACVIAGIANVGLTNTINFYDGADLHIAMLLVLLAAIPLLLPSANPAPTLAATAVLAFALPFALVNVTPKSLYFGDAGSFAVASLVTFFTVTAARDGDGHAALGAIPLMLPAMDVGYVFALRVRLKEDLLSRNYHHLYQQLQIRHRGFWYLLPQPVFTALLLGAALALMAMGLHPLLSVTAASLAMTPLLYFAARAVFVK